MLYIFTMLHCYAHQDAKPNLHNSAILVVDNSLFYMDAHASCFVLFKFGHSVPFLHSFT